ncbi:hypothetical protein [Cellulomonas sp. C5510]|uniref:hypothetical protein n=1 Tax=Cellulomonas sp. C5510 TaxID=2871170 RepID=UPI002105B1C1|nr:hypothetical protein [Cellulomonas sp. C5510]
MAEIPAVTVRREYEWALPPEKHRTDRTAAHDEATLLAQHFRYVRRVRYPEACPPWVLGQELGWIIRAPLTVTVSPVHDLQVDAEADPNEIARLAGTSEFWSRSGGFITAPRSPWLRLHQFRGSSGAWEAVFLPNGDGSVEWRLGFSVDIPDEYFLLTQSIGVPGIDVPPGVLTARQLRRSIGAGGISLAFRPTGDVSIQRGDPIARLVLLHRSSIQARLEVDESADVVGGTA